MQVKVSVIVPIYKVEGFIERCVRSLMEQTLREVEYIFVDDATPDGSIQVLEELIARYPERKEQVHIVQVLRVAVSVVVLLGAAEGLSSLFDAILPIPKHRTTRARIAATIIIIVFLFNGDFFCG